MSGRRQRAWTTGEVNRLRSLWSGGASMVACMRILNRTQRAITHALREHHIRRERARVRGAPDSRTALQRECDEARAEIEAALAGELKVEPYKRGDLRW